MVMLQNQNKIEYWQEEYLYGYETHILSSSILCAGALATEQESEHLMSWSLFQKVILFYKGMNLD